MTNAAVKRPANRTTCQVDFLQAATEISTDELYLVIFDLPGTIQRRSAEDAPWLAPHSLQSAEKTQLAMAPSWIYRHPLDIMVADGMIRGCRPKTDDEGNLVMLRGAKESEE